MYKIVRQDLGEDWLGTPDQVFNCAVQLNYGCVVVYRLFSSTDVLLYVGTTDSPDKRLRGHRQKPWWRDVAAVTLTEFSTRPEADAAEAHAIWTEDPVHNIAGKPGSGFEYRGYRRPPRAFPVRSR